MNTKTKDDQVIILNSPAYSMEDVEKVAASAAYGIGLLSTDFMYTGRDDLPGEEEQLEILLRISRIMDNRPVTVRTLQAPPRMIPALDNTGLTDECRGVRLGLARPDIMQTQLRAIVRAGAEGNFRLLLPMVSDVSEVIKLKETLNTIHHELSKRNISCSSLPDLGIELEVPGAVVMAPVLSFEVSFFSINEKLQHHTLVAKDDNCGIKELLHEYAPSFLFQISNLAEDVRKRHKSVAITAPLAQQLPAIPLLIAMGVNELVIAPERIEQARRIITRLTMSKAKLTASKAMSFWHPDEIQRYAEECLSRLVPGIERLKV